MAGQDCWCSRQGLEFVRLQIWLGLVVRCIERLAGCRCGPIGCPGYHSQWGQSLGGEGAGEWWGFELLHLSQSRYSCNLTPGDETLHWLVPVVARKIGLVAEEVGALFLSVLRRMLMRNSLRMMMRMMMRMSCRVVAFHVVGSDQ